VRDCTWLRSMRSATPQHTRLPPIHCTAGTTPNMELVKVYAPPKVWNWVLNLAM